MLYCKMLAMASKDDQLLEDFGRAFDGLVSLFRRRRYLQMSEQLFIENRLLMLQLEHKLWKQRLHIDRFPETNITKTPSPSLPQPPTN
jgi:hypothetical protein